MIVCNFGTANNNWCAIVFATEQRKSEHTMWLVKEK
jgi:hypothetical protein